jgi:hypothetical protein
MTIWIVQEEDEVTPITELESKRMRNGVWAHRFAGSVGLFEIEVDENFVALLNLHYDQYISQMIVKKHIGSIPEEHSYESERHTVSEL